jgi:hypothetical protein
MLNRPRIDFPKVNSQPSGPIDELGLNGARAAADVLRQLRAYPL